MTERLVFSVMMASVLSFLMSAFVTWMNLGLTADFVSQWLNAFVLAWPAAATISFLFGPGVQRLSTDVHAWLTKSRARA